MNAIIKRQLNDIETINQQASDNLDVLLGNRSANSQKLYQTLWKKYQEWCNENNLEPLALEPTQLQKYLTDHPARPSTQRARVSQLRTMFKLLDATNGNEQINRIYKLLSVYTLPAESTNPMYANIQNRRKPKALHAEEIYTELNREWATTELTIRNRAIIALLFYAGLRRSEVAKLKWPDILWQDGLIAILAGKHRKPDEVDLVPLLVQVERRLRMWQELSSGREFVFCRVNKAGKLLEDKGISGEAIRVICGKEFMPHDGRRTLGTRSIENNTPTNYTQKVLRHKTAAMTLKYGEYVESRQLKDKLKLGY